MLIPVYYGGVLNVADNFASDEIAPTLGVMALALALAVVLGTAVGFWVRRGRPGLIARTLQRWGAHTFRPWYIHILPHALSPALLGRMTDFNSHARPAVRRHRRSGAMPDALDLSEDER